MNLKCAHTISQEYFLLVRGLCFRTMFYTWLFHPCACTILQEYFLLVSSQENIYFRIWFFGIIRKFSIFEQRCISPWPTAIRKRPILYQGSKLTQLKNGLNNKFSGRPAKIPVKTSEKRCPAAMCGRKRFWIN